MNLRTVCCYLAFVFLFITTAFAAEPKLTLYVPFDGSIKPAVAAGNGTPIYGVKDGTPEFAPGIAGQGFLTGGSNEKVRFEAKGNISPDQWTITFWMKGLPGAQWNVAQTPLQQFWQINGEQNEILWFYKYSELTPTPRLYYRPKKNQGDARFFTVPPAPEEEWHFWATTWRKGAGAYMYLDGRLVGQSSAQMPDPAKWIIIGQDTNPSTRNKIIDEFKIYDSAMDAGAIARQYWQKSNVALQPALTVVPAREKITIDGKLNPAEWQNAAGITGLTDAQNRRLESPATTVKSTFDAENIYFAFHSDNPPDVKNDPDNTALHGYVKKDATQHDGAVKEDDHFFIQLQPPHGKLYTIRINGIDTIEDDVTNFDGKVNTAWQSGARAKSILGMDGWTLEVAVPLRSLGITNIADSADWKMNVGRVWKLQQQRTDEWATGKRVKDTFIDTPLGTVTFAKESEPVADLLRFSIAPDGRISATLHVYNPGARSREIVVSLKTADLQLAGKKVTLPTGSSQTITLSAHPENINGALVSIDVQSDGKVLLHQSVPVILEQAGQLALWSYPSSGQIRLGWVIQSSVDPHSLQLTAQIEDAGGKVAKEIALPSLPALTGSAMEDIKTLPDGAYHIDVKINNGETTIQQQRLTFDKKPLPDWLGNSYGISKTPPPPWTDIVVNQAKDTLAVWGRTLDYEGYLLPRQIVNQGKNMLAAPMQITVKSGGAVSSSANGKTTYAKWTETNAVHSSSLRRQTVGPLALTADSYVEFDGMTWLELTAGPQNAKVLLDGLTVEIPLKAEWAKLIKPYDDYRLQHTGLLPANGWKGDASSMPWIGNGDGGFQFFQESAAGWIGSKSIEIAPDGKGAMVLRIHLIDAPATLDKPLHFAFGWMASPVKPAPRDHRDWRIFRTGLITSDPHGTGVAATYIRQAVRLNPRITSYLPWWEGWWWLPGKYTGNYDTSAILPVLDPQSDRANATREYYGIKFFATPYGRLTEMGTVNPWFAQFGDEWVANTSKYTPGSTGNPTQEITKVSQASPSLRDFYAWGYHELLKSGTAHALYFDVSRPMTDSNIYHGAGTKMPDGSIEPIRNILGTRKMFQRLYTMMKTQYPDGKIFYHMSGEMMLPVDSFTDGLIDGENYTGLLDRKGDRGYEKVLSVDQFRTEYSSQNNIGPAEIFLPEFDLSGAIREDEWKDLGYQHARYVLGLILLHDSNIWWISFPPVTLAEAFSALDKTGWNSDWKFIPYWQQKYFSLPEGVYASLYQSPNDKKVLLVLMNTSGKDQNISIPKALGKGTFRDIKALFPEAASITQNVALPDNDFKIILLEK